MSTPHMVILEKVDGQIVRLKSDDEVFAPKATGQVQEIGLEDVTNAVTKRPFIEYTSRSRFTIPPETEWEEPRGTGWLDTRIRVFSRNVISVTEFLEAPDAV